MANNYQLLAIDNSQPATVFFLLSCALSLASCALSYLCLMFLCSYALVLVPLAPDPFPRNLGAQESVSHERENVRKITYEIISKNMQNKPNFPEAQMNVSRVSRKDYENETLGKRGKNKPNSNPIQSQYKPNQSQNKPNTKPIKPNL